MIIACIIFNNIENKNLSSRLELNVIDGDDEQLKWNKDKRFVLVFRRCCFD